MAKTAESGVVVMDSKKFLGTINDSYQAKVALLEQHVRDLGRRVNAT